MASKFDGIPYQSGEAYVLVSQRPGMRVGRSRVGKGRVGSGAVQQGQAKSVLTSVPIEAAADTIGATRLSTYYKDLDGFEYPNVPKGKGRLALYFADFEASGPGQNVMDIAVNGETLITGLDPYNLAGANTEYVLKDDDVDCPGGPFRVTVTATAGHTFLNDATLLVANKVPVPSAPPPPPGSTAFQLGIYHPGGYVGHANFFGSMANREVTILHAFLAGDYSESTMASFLDGEGIGPWLAVDPNRKFVVAYQSFYGHGSSDWYNTSIDANAVLWANLVTNRAASYGFNVNQVVCRLSHEGNGDWGPGQARYLGDHTADFKSYWARVRNAVRAVAPGILFDWNNVAFAIGSVYDPIPCYPGDDVVDYVTFDFYDDYGEFYATKLYQLQDCAAFALAHGKPWGVDEWNLCRSSNGRGGRDDDPAFVTGSFDAMRDLNGSWLLVFEQDWNDETQGEFANISLYTDQTNSVLRPGGGQAIAALPAVLATL